MIELIKERPLLIQIFDWMKLVGYCRDSRDFSVKFIGKSPGYIIACKSMGFTPGTTVYRTARDKLIDLASTDDYPPRRQLFTELAESVEAHILGKTDGGAL